MVVSLLANAVPDRLEQPWIYKDPPPPLPESAVSDGSEFDPRGSEREYDHGPEVSAGAEDRRSRATSASRTSSSSVSLGDTHIWRDG